MILLIILSLSTSLSKVRLIHFYTLTYIWKLSDQLSLNQPKGIKEIHQNLTEHYKDSHEIEHLMMECIAEMIYISQKNNTTMDQVSYLKCITSLTTK